MRLILRLIFGENCDNDTIETVLGGLFRSGYVCRVTAMVADELDPVAFDMIPRGVEYDDEGWTVLYGDEWSAEPLVTTGTTRRVRWDDIVSLEVY